MPENSENPGPDGANDNDKDVRLPHDHHDEGVREGDVPRSNGRRPSAQAPDRPDSEEGSGGRVVEVDGEGAQIGYEDNGSADQAALIRASFSGPLPVPGMLEGYGRVDPSFPERIMAMAEHEAHAKADAIEVQTRTVSKGVLIGAWTTPLIAVGGFIVMVIGMVLGKDITAIAGAIPAAITASAKMISVIKANGDSD